MPGVSDKAPALSVGLAVRNARDVLGRCIESVLSQDFTDLELVICDNVSDDGTITMLEKYARSDPRIVLSVNEVNIGSHGNMRRVLDLSRGTFFRWISADDWLEPGCLSACVRALESHPNAIGVTTWFTIHTADGAPRYEEYRGEFRHRRILHGASNACCGSSTRGTRSTTLSMACTGANGLRAPAPFARRSASTGC